ACIVCEDAAGVPEGVPFASVADTRQAAGPLAQAVRGWPARKLTCVAVTGTNGKTTTVKYCEAMLLAAGRRVLSIGTLGLSLNGQPVAETGFTSPPYLELRRILSDYRDQADTLVMEISSHALDQGRVYALPLDAAAWTNFSQDHLDYHGDEASYFAAKARILELLKTGVPLLTSSAEVAGRLRARFGPGAPVARLEVPELPAAVLAERPFLRLGYNRENYALATALATSLLGNEPAEPWRRLQPVDGRFDCHVYRNRTIVIDFAHTPDALANILGAIRAGFPAARVLTLFGCGGDRDPAKRPLMGAAVCRDADHVILTSDNPRYEDPQAIIDDTLRGMTACQNPPQVVPDRSEAVRALFELLASRPMEEPWVALIAGKGHERYIDQDGVKRPYSDQEEVARNLQRLGWTDE
ncbi:MAG: UDP-N-acetylmuramoyl-L-alanyl-D-glutamate--2,6-diaminopimelate ligase, partial [Gammaproteobacteria bacterium]|nr:UDP-N-acetylmuramoyl-L-alanyl-D-glutamate--2,6-diaminopimelate ligase [Gammaproteobacteria bacterium]